MNGWTAISRRGIAMTTKKSGKKEKPEEEPEPKELNPTLAHAVETIAAAAQSTNESERTDGDKLRHFATYLRDVAASLEREAAG